jgi:hypothetical protein
MVVRWPVRRIVFLIWALVACPVIGVMSVVLTYHGSDASALAMCNGLPSTLALAGGLVLRPGCRWIVGSLGCPLIGLIVLLAWIGFNQGN